MFRILPNNPKGFKETYRFNITRYYRIWFSKDPAVFLGIENELRFIRMRKENPTASLFFIYSSKCLNASSKDRIIKFCKVHQIKPIDFDTELYNLLKEEADKKLYVIAQEEITRSLNKQYGNLAAAADCVRLLIPVIEHFGIYTDFDVECKLSQLGADVIDIKAPLLLNVEILNHPSYTVVSVNSDFLACSVNLANLMKLSDEALTSVRGLQQIIIKNYTDPVTEATILKGHNPEEFKPLTDLPEIFKKFKLASAESKEHTIYTFRKYVAALPLSPAKTHLNKMSVMNISGPGIYTELYKQLFPAKFTQAPEFVPKNSEWLPYLSLFRKSSIGFYDLIADRVTTSNNIQGAIASATKKDSITCDHSWLEDGAANKKAREDKMVSAAISLQRIWKRNDFTIKHYKNPPQYSESDFKPKKLS